MKRIFGGNNDQLLPENVNIKRLKKQNKSAMNILETFKKNSNFSCTINHNGTVLFRQRKVPKGGEIVPSAFFNIFEF